MMYLVLILIFGIVLFITSLIYMEHKISFVGLVLSAFILGISCGAIQDRLDKKFKDNRVTQKGVVIETQSGDLGCVNLKER